MQKTRMTLVLVGCLALEPVARADVPPPAGYVENCTLERTCPVGDDCVLCPADANDRNQEKSVCKQNLGDLGYSKQCQSWGSSVWKEVWCRPASGSLDATVTIVPLDGSAGAPTTMARIVRCEARGGGCGSCSVRNGHGGTVAAALALSALALIRIRRARTTAPPGS